ncbi:KAP family P-loop NTPase fold protein [Aliiglaciecola lipolytica]|uniref:KAP NTPase domain-containing protein n=1 Tax=Aliiglaciecola lipolytica E3 TaxID=1127673 RepID=K6X7L4_9ALTE|nr:P-loop NTPase fold protein [Aliiglaciecola lipolytica]GAC16619.1 hypothetical protein GLIP_4008 [Aliiglaciecola lipolytica E3]
MQVEVEQATTKSDSYKRKVAEDFVANKLAKEPMQKSAFPKARFILAIVIILTGILACILITKVTPLNPTPLISPFNIFSPMSWYYPLERNAALRLNLVDTNSTISAYQVDENQLALQFEDGSLLYLANHNVSQVNSANADIDMPVLNRNFTLRSASNNQDISNDLFNGIDGLFDPLFRQNVGIGQVSIIGYLSRSQPLTNDDLDRLRQSPMTAKAAEPKQKISSYDPPQEQKTSALNPAFAQDQSTLLAQSVADYITSNYPISASNIVVGGYGFDRHYSDDWQVGSGPNNGVFVSIIPAVSEASWTALPDREVSPIVIPVPQLIDKSWEIYNRDIIVYRDGSISTKTEAILPSALNRHDLDAFAKSNWATEIEDMQHQVFPSPIALLLLVGSVFIALRVLVVGQGQKDVEVIRSQQLIDSFVSDSPANDLTQDKLGFQEISSALSRFLRNSGTKAPLTIAITGLWGSGKSSLMYFLKQNLESFRLHPVWVNAWHHQNEEQFLAGLLSAIQSHAIPPFWTAAGMLYRWNLLKMRWVEAPLFFFSVTVIFLCSLGYILTSGEATLKPLSDFSTESIPYLGAVFGAFSLLRGGMDRISGMVNTNPLKSLFRSPGRNLDLRANLGLREKFAKEFSLLCNALGDSTLTIFIDDLDRCKEQRIMDVMETINYLVSSGDCYIIVGMEREPIENAICSYYQSTHTDVDQDALKIKAKRYLEKIINIEIPVPTASSDQFDGLVSSNISAPPEAKFTWLKPLLIFLVFIASFLIGSYFSSLINNEQPISSVDKPVIETATTQQNTEGDNLAVQQQESSIETTMQSEQPKILNYKTFESKEYVYWLMLPVLLLTLFALLIRVERFRQRKRIVENDSDEFLHAVSLWAKVLGISHRTPRNIKRYVNRARYLAMRNYESGAGIREANLVTLTAILEFNRGQLDEDSDGHLVPVPEIADQELQTQINLLLNQSEKIDLTKRQKFMYWVRGVNVN